MEHGVLYPISFTTAYFQTLEQIAMTQEIFLDSGKQQRLAEPAWTAQKNELRSVDKPIDILGFINIQ
jgi:hypothetical protein